jgi:hypothetical protein
MKILTHLSLERKPFTLVGGASSTLFPSENWVHFWRAYSQKIRVFHTGKKHLVPHRHIQLNWKTYVSLERKASMFEAGACSTLLPCENSVDFWKEYYLPIRVFKGRKHILFQICLFSRIEENMYFSKENHLREKVDHLAHYLSGRIELAFERNTASPSGFSRWRNTHFVSNRAIQLNWRNSFISRNKSIYVRQRSIYYVVPKWELS